VSPYPFDLVRHAEDRMADGFDGERQHYETNKQAARARREAWEVDVKAAVKAAAVLILVDGGEAEGPHRLGKGLGG